MLYVVSALVSMAPGEKQQRLSSKGTVAEFCGAPFVVLGASLGYESAEQPAATIGRMFRGRVFFVVIGATPCVFHVLASSRTGVSSRSLWAFSPVSLARKYLVCSSLPSASDAVSIIVVFAVYTRSACQAWGNVAEVSLARPWA